MNELPYGFKDDEYKSQVAWVKQQVLAKGFITRNECLRSYISRLSAIIFILKEQGMMFTVERVKNSIGSDYIYYYKGE
jgi:hypothetical protein